MRTLIGLLLSASLALATTLTGTLKDPSGAGITGFLYLSVAQQAALSSAGSCGGPVEIVPTVEVKITVTNGALIGSPSVYGNDCMLPQNIYYNVRLTDANANVLLRDRWLITGTTIDVGTIVSVVVSGTTTTLGSVGVVLTVPTSNQIVNQPAMTTTSFNFLNVTDTFTFPNGAVCNTGGCTGLVNNVVTTNTAQAIAAVKTFSSSPIFAANTDLGSAASPARFGFFNLGTVQGPLKFIQGTTASPTDFFVLQADPTVLHKFEILDSSDNTIFTYGAGGDPGGDGLWSHKGFVFGTLGLYNAVVPSTFDCSSIVGLASGGEAQYVVTDTSPPQIMVCIEGVKYKVDLVMP